MASLFPKIYEYIESNPFRDVQLTIGSTSSTNQGSTWDAFTVLPLQPPGALSHFLYATDPLYAAGTPLLRKQLLTEALVPLQSRVDTELVGRKWPRKKIQDQLASQISINLCGYSELLEQVLCELFQIQKVVLHRSNQTISLFPDPRSWTSEKPILVSDTEYCWVYETQSPIDILAWLTQKEDAGWKVQWPVAEGSLEEVKGALLAKHLTAHPKPGSDGKVRKEDWARALGRAETLSYLALLHLRYTTQ